MQHDGQAKHIVASELAAIADGALDMLRAALDALVRLDDETGWR